MAKPKRQKKEPIKSWIVTVQAKVTKEVVTTCTESEANDDPFANATDERDTSLDDWQVMDVRENV